MTSRGREALVTDFGLAREVVELPVKDLGRKLSLVGSAFWMAPEMLRGEPYDRKVTESCLYYINFCDIICCKLWKQITWLLSHFVYLTRDGQKVKCTSSMVSASSCIYTIILKYEYKQVSSHKIYIKIQQFKIRSFS